jgi:hypothetical protein
MCLMCPTADGTVAASRQLVYGPQGRPFFPFGTGAFEVLERREQHRDGMDRGDRSPDRVSVPPEFRFLGRAVPTTSTCS